MVRKLKLLIVGAGLLACVGCNTLKESSPLARTAEKTPVAEDDHFKRYVPAISDDISAKLKAIIVLVNPLDPADSDEIYERAYQQLLATLKYCDGTCNGNEYAQIYIQLAWISSELDRDTQTLEYYDLALSQAPQISYGLEAVILMDAVRLSVNFKRDYKVDAYLNRLAAINPGRFENVCYRSAQQLLASGEYEQGLVSINNCIESGERIQNGFTVPTVAYKTKLALLDAIGIENDRVELERKLATEMPQADDYRSVFKLPATYPIDAIASRAEGFCIVEYDILESGRTANVNVTECSNSAFAENSIKTAKNFLYKPRVENSKPVVVTGVKNKFIFKYEQYRL